MSKFKIDPQLRKQLDAASGTDASVGAVFSLRMPAGKALARPEAEQAIRAILDRVTREVGVGPGRLRIFTSVCSFVVSAPASYVEGLLQQKELATAMANVQDQDMFIRPRDKRITGPHGSRRKR